MNMKIMFALIVTFMIANPVIFWNEINWLRGLLIYFEVALVFVAWLTYKLTRKHYEKKAYHVLVDDASSESNAGDKNNGN